MTARSERGRAGRGAAPSQGGARARLANAIDALSLEAAANMPAAKVESLARQWLAKADLAAAGEEEAGFRIAEAMTLAGFLLLFEPSMSGATPLQRFARARKAEDDDARAALRALAQAQFRLLRLEAHLGRGEVTAADLVDGARLTLYDEDLPAQAMGVPVAAWIAPWPDGRCCAIGPMTPLDPGALAQALAFAREGKGLRNPWRCAAAVLKHVTRQGAWRVEGINHFSDAEPEPVEDEREFDELDRLAHLFEKADAAAAESEARPSSSAYYLEEALVRAAILHDMRRSVQSAAYARLAFVLMETLERRAAVGSGGLERPLDAVAHALAQDVKIGRAPPFALELYADLQRKLGAARRGPAGDDELTRVLQRIRALRAKTVEQGCTEQEAIASARKVAELLDRYGLSLGEAELRHQTCEGVGVETGRKRRIPFDQCVGSIAAFCDCRVWNELAETGALRYVFFGLPADVEAAHYLYDLIDATFEAESKRIKKENARAASPAERLSVNSFQIGLSHGVIEKLKTIKAERDADNRRVGGRDLVPVKTAAIEDELEKLGLNLTRKAHRQKKRVELDAYEAGRETGRAFEPRRGLRADEA